MSDRLLVNEKKIGDRVVCYMEGEINIDTVSGLKKVFKKIVDKGARKVLLNFEKVEYIDSLGIATLIELVGRLEATGGRMAIFGVSPKIGAIFKVTKIDKVFKVFDTEKEAIAAF